MYFVTSVEAVYAHIKIINLRAIRCGAGRCMFWTDLVAMHDLIRESRNSSTGLVSIPESRYCFVSNSCSLASPELFTNYQSGVHRSTRGQHMKIQSRYTIERL